MSEDIAIDYEADVQLGRISYRHNDRRLDGSTYWSVEQLVKDGNADVILDALDSAVGQLRDWRRVADEYTGPGGDTLRKHNQELGERNIELHEQLTEALEAVTTLGEKVDNIGLTRKQLDNLIEAAHQEADDRGWCDDFDDFMERNGLPRRTGTTVRIEALIPVTITATVSRASQRSLDAGWIEGSIRLVDSSINHAIRFDGDWEGVSEVEVGIIQIQEYSTDA